MDPILKIGGAVAVAAVVVVAVSSIGRRYAPDVPSYPASAYSRDLAARIAADQARLGPKAPTSVVETGGIRLRSVGFELPTEGRAFPPGPGQDVVAGNCQSCHTAGMILTQPRLTRAEWAAEVAKMVNVYKAPVDGADVPVIVGYLAGLTPGP